MRLIGSIIGLLITGAFIFMVYRLITSFLSKNDENEGDNKEEEGRSGNNIPKE